MANVYAIGAVKPWVKDAANEIGNRFGITTIYGVGARSEPNSDHPKGLALDFMCDQATGDQLANYVQANYAVYNVQYIIWRQKIWNVSRASEGWRPMADRGSVTANHYDHVHVSFKAFATIQGNRDIVNPPGGLNLPGGINIPDPLQGVKDTLSGISTAANFVTNSHNWLRVGSVALGSGLILLALVMLISSQPSAAKAAKTVTKTVKKAAGTKSGTKFKATKASRPGGASYDPKG